MEAKDKFDTALYLFEAFKILMPYLGMLASFWLGNMSK